ncbi:glutathione S-transferase family protein [Pseudomonas sp. CGJS7]|uniref:glutathione S-transferase family protein n=1 Tax=Pseudomonas sp. CGJS7 TaxID=3109348 RepID=UPI0030087C9F
MKLYYCETPNARLACAAARHLDAPVELIRVDLKLGEQRHPDYLALNPNGKVPTLIHGDTVLWEAPAIVCYLAQVAGSDLWPADPAAQFDVLRWINWSTAHFNRHAGSLFFERVIKPGFGIGEPSPAVLEEAGKYFRQFAKVLNGQLQDRRYLLGERLSAADFAVATMLPWTQAAQLPLDGFAAIGDWYARIDALPGWRDPYPARDVGAAAAA